MDSRLRRKPLLPKGENDGPTCKPILYTKSINPKSLAKRATCGSMVTPKEANKIPTKRIHVMPKENFLIRKCSPAQRPNDTTIVSSTMDWVTEGVMNKSRMYSISLFSERGRAATV